MKECTDYAIWLRKNTVAFEDGVYHYAGKDYHIDSVDDMRHLHMKYWLSGFPKARTAMPKAPVKIIAGSGTPKLGLISGIIKEIRTTFKK